MPKGGKRQGAGRKAKSLLEKAENNSGHREIKYIPPEVVGDIIGEEMPPPDDWLKGETKNTQSANRAVNIYEATWKWLAVRKCDHLITPQQIAEYAQTVARYIQCQEGINAFGYLSKHPTTNAPIKSPYFSMANECLKESTRLWGIIWQIVKENCTVAFDGKSDNIMEQILNGKI
jgi:hypothetical protein